MMGERSYVRFYVLVLQVEGLSIAGVRKAVRCDQ
jgi:hypothetical protein